VYQVNSAITYHPFGLSQIKPSYFKVGSFWPYEIPKLFRAAPAFAPTLAEPVPPRLVPHVPLVTLLVDKFGISDSSNYLKLGVPLAPLGDANTLFFVCEPGVLNLLFI
jgi:hypothetical protein